MERQSNLLEQFPKNMETEEESISKQESGVYSAQDIQIQLGIGRSKTYEYLEEVYKKQEPFRVIKIGKLLRVPKESFDNWLNAI